MPVNHSVLPWFCAVVSLRFSFGKLCGTENLHPRCSSPPTSSPPPTAVRSRPSVPTTVMSTITVLPAPTSLPVLQPTPCSPLRRPHTPVLQSLNQAQPGTSTVNELTFARTFPNLSIPASDNCSAKTALADLDSRFEYLEPDVLYQQEISPKPSEAIDDECDFVTLDSSIFALPTAIETTESNQVE